jgi:bacteriochlorophyll C8 methyltransferase
MRIVIANTVGKLDNGQHVIPFPSRWDYAGSEHWFSYYPYELAYTSTLLKREFPNDDIVMVDGNHEQLGVDEYIARLRPLQPDVLITECSALTYPAMTKVMQGVGPQKAYLTGPYGMHNRIKAVDDGWWVFSGEYEHKIAAWLKGEKEPKEYIDLDWLPWPEDNDISRINYSEYSNPMPGLIQVYPTRGCPLSCTFCVVPMYYGGHGHSHKSHRCRDVNDVCDELEYLAMKYHGRFNGAFFNEETHNANVEWLASFAETLIQRGLNRYHYDAMCGYWTFTEDLVKLLAAAGYCYIRVGIESLNQNVGKSIKKVVFEDKLTTFLEWCKAAGIRVYGTSQIGAQGSSEEADLQTLEGLWSLKQRGLLHRWQHSVSTPQPGTPFYDQVKRDGYLLTEDVQRYNGVQAVVSWPHYPSHRIDYVKAVYSHNAPRD